MFPVYCVDDGVLGARASRPHKAWHSLGHLLHLDRPNGATALLRPGRCGYRRRGGCLQSRADAQRPPYGSGCGRDARAPRGCEITPSWRESRRCRPGAADDPVRVCGCPGLQDAGLPKPNPVHPVHRCKLMYSCSTPSSTICLTPGSNRYPLTTSHYPLTTALPLPFPSLPMCR